METVTALVAAGAAFGLSYLIGRSLTASFLMVALGGLLSGIGFAVLFFVSTVTVGHLMPHLFEPWLLGVHFIVLMACGAARQRRHRRAYASACRACRCGAPAVLDAKRASFPQPPCDANLPGKSGRQG